jgi:hypothetical protein
LTRWLNRLRLWARSDRIRASPREGRLLRLRPGACVRVGDACAARVIAREVRECPGDGAAAEVRYTCQTATSEFHLHVCAGETGSLNVWLEPGGAERRRPLPPESVDAFG